MPRLETLIGHIERYYPENHFSQNLCHNLLIDSVDITRHKAIYYMGTSTKINYKPLTQQTLDEANHQILNYFIEINRALFFFIGANYKNIIPEDNFRVAMPYQGNKLAERMAYALFCNAQSIRNYCIDYFEKAVDYLVSKGKVETKTTFSLAHYKAKMICPECGKPLKARYGKGRWFLGCTGYPNCNYTRKYVSKPKELNQDK